MQPHALSGKRIVVAALGMPDHVIPLISLALALSRRGHAVAVATGRAYAQDVRACGLEFTAIAPNVLPTDAEAVALFRSGGGRALAAREVFAHTLRGSYDDLCRAVEGADLLLTGEMTFASPLVAEATGITWASAAVTPSSFYSVFDPPAPAVTRPVRAVRLLSQRAGRALVRRQRPGDRRFYAQVCGLRGLLELPPSETDPLFEGAHSPDLVLALFPEILSRLQRDWPPQAVQAGYPFDAPTNYPRDDAADVTAFLCAGLPPFVFSLGTCPPGESEAFSAAGAEAARLLGRRAMFLADSNSAHPRSQDGPPVSACAERWELFRRGAVVVHRGGAIDTAHSLRSGRPCVIVPRADEERDNAARLAGLGVALTLEERHFCADSLADALSRIGGDPEFERAAGGARARVEAGGGVAAACEAVEELLFHEPGGSSRGARAQPAREARAIEAGLAVLREMSSDAGMPPLRPPHKHLFLGSTLFFMLLFAGMWWFYIHPLPPDPRPAPGGAPPAQTRPASTTKGGPTDRAVTFIFLVVAAATAAPVLGYVTKKSLDWLSDERIEEPGYERRIIFDLRYAARLRRAVGGVERLKVLASHVKRDTDKTADRINAIAQAASSVGIFLAGALLVAERGDATRAGLIAAMAVIVAAFARASATLRLAMYRHWQAVIEQAQNLRGYEASGNDT